MSLEIIQIIEDDPVQAGVLDRALRKVSYRTNVAHDGQTGIEDVKRLLPALVLLDLMLPDMDGREVCRRIREDPKTQDIPIIMLTGLGSEEHCVGALDHGADDYIVKPFKQAELTARIKAVLRRTHPPVHQKNECLEEGLVLEEDQFVAVFRGQRVILSGQEWRLLRRLTGSDGQVVPREELSILLWGEDGLIHEHELDRCIQTLSQKLTDNAVFSGSIVMEPGGGYRLSALHPSTAGDVPRSHP
ncbi:MAG: response regulator transcription factor [Nitrospirae bacterium]|nr:response regulator transcription factor [Nitrospirota bacterium]